MLHHKKTAKETKAEDSLLRGINEAATHLRVLWISFFLFSVYLACSTIIITDKNLFLENPIKLPGLYIELSLQFYFWFAPFLLIILHGYLLLHIVLIRDRIKHYVNQKIEIVRHDQVDTLLFVQAEFSSLRKPDLRKYFSYLTFAATILPVLIFALLISRSSAYQDTKLILCHGVLLFVDIFLISCFHTDNTHCVKRLLIALLMSIPLNLIVHYSNNYLNISNQIISDQKFTSEISKIDSDSKSYGANISHLLHFVPSQHRKFHKADFTSSDLRYLDFNKSELQNADFRNALLEGTDFKDAIFDNTWFCKESVEKSIYLKAAEQKGKIKSEFCDQIPLLFRKEIAEGNIFGIDGVLENTAKFKNLDIEALACTEKPLPEGSIKIPTQIIQTFKIFANRKPVTECTEYKFNSVSIIGDKWCLDDGVYAANQKYKFCILKNGQQISLQAEEMLNKLDRTKLSSLELEIKSHGATRSGYVISYTITDNGKTIFPEETRTINNLRCEGGEDCEVDSLEEKNKLIFLYHDQEYRIAFRVGPDSLHGTIKQYYRE